MECYSLFVGNVNIKVMCEVFIYYGVLLFDCFWKFGISFLIFVFLDSFLNVVEIMMMSICVDCDDDWDLYL